MRAFAHDPVVPYDDSGLSKKEQVAGMFDNISPRYDLLNRLLSGGTDLRWRKKAIAELKANHPRSLLDIATGTGDMAILAACMLAPCRVTGLDISEGMLETGRKKVAAQSLEDSIQLLKGDAEAINYPDETFDSVMVAFGVRNFQDLARGIREMRRVMKTGGKMVILEFSKPKNPLVAPMYALYMTTVAPIIGKLFSKNIKAYRYLNKSIQKFPEGKEFIAVLNEAGFEKTEHKPLSFGICSIYCAIK